MKRRDFIIKNSLASRGKPMAQIRASCDPAGKSSGYRASLLSEEKY